MAELKHSVRAHGDRYFQRLQEITRMDPFELIENSSARDEFHELVARILAYVPSWNNRRISPNMMKAFSRKCPAQEAVADYRESIRRKLTNEGISYYITRSIYTKK